MEEVFFQLKKYSKNYFRDFVFSLQYKSVVFSWFIKHLFKHVSNPFKIKPQMILFFNLFTSGLRIKTTVKVMKKTAFKL